MNTITERLSKFGVTVCMALLGAMLSAAECADTEDPDMTKKEDPSNKSADQDSDQGPHALDSDTAPVEQNPTVAYDGIDLVVVVDNSGSMAEEQEILTTGVYTLVNQLTNPVSQTADPTWGFPARGSGRASIPTSSAAGCGSGP